jgi:hypothetical protein
MPRPKSGIPSFRLHKASGQAIVTIDGQDQYLGKWGSHTAIVRYRRAIGDLCTERAEAHLKQALFEALNKLESLSVEMASLQNQIDLIRHSVNSFEDAINGDFPSSEKYPEPPKPMGACGLDEPPNASGIYFLHNDGCIEYVGKSNDIRNRIGRAGSKRHHAVRPNDEWSFLPFPIDVLLFTECYYIWRIKPIRNFGFDSPVKADLV